LWIFEQQKPIRNVGLVAGPYERVERKAAGGMTLDAFVFPGHERGGAVLLEVTEKAFRFFAARFGEVGGARFTLVEMPEAFGVGSGYGECGYVLCGTGAFREAGSVSWASSLVAHEVSHTWWGQEVGFHNFASETLASYATYKFLEETEGKEAALRERRGAVERVISAATEGREAALADIRGFGVGMHPVTYSTHAYQKGLMILAMIEREIGEKRMNGLLETFFEKHRGTMVDYAVLRQALIKSGSKGATVLKQWEVPGIPRLALEHQSRTAGRKVKVTGVLTQDGTIRPFKMTVDVVARWGDSTKTASVKLTKKKAKFSMILPEEPDAILIDPEYRLLVYRPRVGPVDPEEVIKEALKVVSNPKQGDPGKCRKTIRMLRGLLKAGAGKHEGLSYTCIGRCLFRLGEFDEAIEAFEKSLSLGSGGPFHRAWIRLRLGCIADLRKEREKAVAYYESVLETGKGYTAKLAARFKQSPYRGYKKDG
ncbi:MAG: M1 family aminopeptidase, partial [Planctomycetota bacterium]